MRSHILSLSFQLFNQAFEFLGSAPLRLLQHLLFPTDPRPGLDIQFEEALRFCLISF
jgi:hypothetical protein